MKKKLLTVSTVIALTISTFSFAMSKNVQLGGACLCDYECANNYLCCWASSSSSNGVCGKKNKSGGCVKGSHDSCREVLTRSFRH